MLDLITKEDETESGDYVEIVGLLSAPELNGKLGQLIGYHKEADRFSMKINGVPGTKAIKMANVRRRAREWDFDDLPSFVRHERLRKLAANSSA